MSGNWLVDAIKGDYCSNMNVSGPSSAEAWTNAKKLAKNHGVELQLGSCDSKGYSNVSMTLEPKTFTRGGYEAKWDGKVWTK
jgi:hypothetical protein